jgi:hypothetical protein
MTPERADELLSGLLDGALEAREHRELLEAALQDPALGRHLAELLKLQPFLVDALAGEEGEEGFQNRVRHAMSEQSDTAFIRAIVQKASDSGSDPAKPSQGKAATRRSRTRRWPSDGPRTNPWVLLLAAASVLLVLGLLLFSASTPVPKETVRRDTTRERLRERQSQAEAERARAEAERKRLEDELRRMEDSRRNAEAAELKARTELKEEERRRAEAELRRIAEEQKAAEARLAKAQQEERKAEEAVKAAAPDPAPAETKTAAARLERVEGDVQILSQGSWTPARIDQDVLEGQGLDIRGRNGRAVLRYADKTKVELSGTTRLRKVTVDGGKRFSVEEGSILADVAKQPKGQPMLIATPHGDATVVGTTLRIVVDPDPKKGTRLTVEEGKVELKDLAGKTVLVESGHYAVAGIGVELAARRVVPPLLADDFQDRRRIATEWEAILGGLPTSYANGRIEIDTTPRPAEEYAVTSWHTPGGLRTKKAFALPLRIVLDVETSSADFDVSPVLVLKPTGAAVGAGAQTYSSKDVLQVARRKDVVTAVVGTGTAERELKSSLFACRGGESERWAVEIGRELLVVSVNGTEILRELHRMEPSRRFQIGLEASGKREIPAGIKVRFDNVMVERAD